MNKSEQKKMKMKNRIQLHNSDDEENDEIMSSERKPLVQNEDENIEDTKPLKSTGESVMNAVNDAGTGIMNLLNFGGHQQANQNDGNVDNKNEGNVDDNKNDEQIDKEENIQDEDISKEQPQNGGGGLFQGLISGLGMITGIDTQNNENGSKETLDNSQKFGETQKSQLLTAQEKLALKVKQLSQQDEVAKNSQQKFYEEISIKSKIISFRFQIYKKIFQNRSKFLQFSYIYDQIWISFIFKLKSLINNFKKLEYDLNKQEQQHQTIEDIKFLEMKAHPNNQGKRWSYLQAIKSDIGRHDIMDSTLESDFNTYGIAILLYFKTVKYLTICFFIFMWISFPVYVFANQAAKNRNAIDNTSYLSYIYSMSLGPFAINTYLTQKIQFLKLEYPLDGDNQEEYLSLKSSILGSNKKKEAVRYNQVLVDIQSSLELQNRILSTVELNCESGMLAGEEYFKDQKYNIGIVTRSIDITSDPKLIDQNLLHRECINEDVFLLYYLKNCANYEKCKFEIIQNFFKTEIQECKDQVLKYPILISAYCRGDLLVTPIGKFKKSSVGNIIIFCDACIVFLFILFVMNLQKCSDVATENILEKNVSPSLFTLEFTNLPFIKNKDQLIGTIWYKIEQLLQNYAQQNQEKGSGISIMDVKLCMADEVYNLMARKLQLIQKKNQLVNEWKYRYDKENNIMYPIYLQNLIDFQKKMVQNKSKAMQQLNSIKTLQRRIDRIAEQIAKESMFNDRQPKSAFVVFATIDHKQIAKDYYQKNFYDWCNFKMGECCYPEDTQRLADKLIDCKDAPDPSNIIWDNINVSKSSFYIRQLITLAITLLLIAINWQAMVQVKKQQWKIQQSYPLVVCNSDIMKYATESQVIEEFLEPINKFGYIECFCKQDLINNLKKEFEIDPLNPLNKVKICNQWWSSYQWLQLYFPLLICFFIITLNLVMQKIFLSLSYFERHVYMQNQSFSRIAKILLTQFINSALIILFANMRVTSDDNKDIAFIQENSGGKYMEMGYEWMKINGPIIVCLMAVNILTIPIGIFINKGGILIQAAIQEYINKRSLSSQKKTENKIKFTEGPEFLVDLRYATVLNSVFVSFVFTSILPALYGIIFLSMVVIMFSDKVYLLTICRNPVKQNNLLNKYSVETLYFVIYFHIIIAIWAYGNPKLFNLQSGSSQDFDTGGNDFIQYLDLNLGTGLLSEFKTRLFLPQNFFHSCQLLLMTIVFILNQIFSKPLELIMQKSKQLSEKLFKKYKIVKYTLQNTKYIKFLSIHSLKQEIGLIELKLNNQGSSYLINRYKQLVKYLNEEIERKQAQIQKFKVEPNLLDIDDAQLSSKQMVQKRILALKIQGQFSYDIRYNVRFKEIFEIKTEADIEAEEIQEKKRLLDEQKRSYLSQKSSAMSSLKKKLAKQGRIKEISHDVIDSQKQESSQKSKENIKNSKSIVQLDDSSKNLKKSKTNESKSDKSLKRLKTSKSPLEKMMTKKLGESQASNKN